MPSRRAVHLLVMFTLCLCGLVAVGYRQLNRAMPDSGTSFTWGVRAFGPWIGWMTGWGLVAATVIIEHRRGTRTRADLAGATAAHAQLRAPGSTVATYIEGMADFAAGRVADLGADGHRLRKGGLGDRHRGHHRGGKKNGFTDRHAQLLTPVGCCFQS